MITIEGQTNVVSARFGGGCLSGIGKEIGKFVVTTMDIPWQVTRDHIGGSPESVIMIESVEQDWLDKALATAPECNAILAIGGGQAVDAGKYFAWKRGIRLVTVPTIVSVDAFVTPAAGVRKNHDVIYVGEASPDPLIIDYDIIRTAPAELNIAGIGDLLSMHTASFDWELAEQRGKSEYPFSSAAVAGARDILAQLYEQLTDIRNVTDSGLRAIVEGYMRLNTICLPAGHYRIEEGSEHFLFYELEERLKRPFIHGYIVGLGIYLMSRLQNNEAGEISKIMNDVGLLYQPAVMDINRADLVASLRNLRNYVTARERLWYTIIDDTEITDDWIEAAIEGLQFPD